VFVTCSAILQQQSLHGLHCDDRVSSSGKPGTQSTRHTVTVDAEELAYWVAGSGSMFGQHHRSGIVMGAGWGRGGGQTGLLSHLNFETRIKTEKRTKYSKYQ
jgi:hypothetical protein